jgi:hypothetical protein
VLAIGRGFRSAAGMRRKPEQQLAMLTSLSTEDLTPEGPSDPAIRKVVDEVLAKIGGESDARSQRMTPRVVVEK